MQSHHTQRRVVGIYLEAKRPGLEILCKFKALTGVHKKEKMEDVFIYEGMPLVSYRNLPRKLVKNTWRYEVLGMLDGEGGNDEVKVAVRWCKV